MIPATTPTPVGASRSPAVVADLREVDGRKVAWFRLEGGKHAGSIGVEEGDAIRRLIHLAVETGIPVVGILNTSGADVGQGVAALHAWGRIASELARASGVVPTLLGVVGPCVSGPALLLGMVDQAVFTRDAFSYLSGPDAVTTFTGVPVTRESLGGAAIHERQTGVAALVVDDDLAVDHAVASILAYLPQNNVEDPPRLSTHDSVERETDPSVIPTSATAAYDVRELLHDVFDSDTVLELRAGYARNIVTALACLGGRPVGIVANQPAYRAGTLDIDASQKAARFVNWCDTFNIPLITFVDTPGFEPGRDLEWRGMIRHGAQLVHAYGEATVPRCCVILRKAYGGAYIVMDSRGLGNDWCMAWPGAEIAVMGARGAVEILHRRRLADLDEAGQVTTRTHLEDEYAQRFLNPREAAERGLVDTVLDGRHTRTALAGALDGIATKREHHPTRRHSNISL